MVREANKPCGAAGEVVLSSSLRAKGEQSLWSCQPWSSSLVDPRTTCSCLFYRCAPLPSAQLEHSHGLYGAGVGSVDLWCLQFPAAWQAHREVLSLVWGREGWLP